MYTYLFYGPAGCGKTLLARAIVGELNKGILNKRNKRSLGIFVASEILKKPRAMLEKAFAQIERSSDTDILIENVDELFVDLREEKAAHRYLLDRIRSTRSILLFLATTRRPELLLLDELSVFSDILPCFYPDEKGRIGILEKHVRKRQITLPSAEILTDIAKKTEWWSGEELEQLIVQATTPTNAHCLSVPSVNKYLAKIGQTVIVRRRENRTHELVEFTKEHCTHNDIISEVARFEKRGDSTGPPHINTRTVVNNVVNMMNIGMIGQAGSVGHGSVANNVTFNQKWNDIRATVDMSQLAEQLSRLRQALLQEAQEANEPQQYAAIGEIASAEIEAKNGNGSKILEHLAKAGKWTFDVATRIGEKVAAALIKESMGV